MYYHSVTRYVFYLLPIMVVLSAFGLALALFLLGFAGSHAGYRCWRFALLQIWMFATPVVYPLSAGFRACVSTTI